MNYSEIEAFFAIIEKGSLNKAAESLYISQPALTHRIKNLEKEVGGTIFIRQQGIRNISLTRLGKNFMPIALKWKKLWNETKSINNLSKINQLNVIATDSINTYIMPKVYHKLLDEDNISLNIETMHSFQAYSAIENHESDIGFVTTPMYLKNVITTPISKEKMMLICVSTQKYNKVVSPEDLDVTKEVRLSWNQEYSVWHDYWFGVNSKEKILIDHMSLMEDLIIKINGWAIVPASVAFRMQSNKNISVYALKNGPKERVCYAIVHKDSDIVLEDQRILKEFKSVIKEIEEMRMTDER